MSIKTILDTAMTDLFNQVGDDATYTPVSGAPLSCKVWVTKNVELQPTDFTGQAIETATLLECLLSEVLTVPKRGSTFLNLIDSITYTMQTVQKNDGRKLILVVK